MQKTERFFIFSWREVTVISLLVLISVGFFFTLGLHYGKKLNPGAPVTADVAKKLEESPESLPSRETLEQASQNSASVAQEEIKTATEQEVKNSGVKTDLKKPVDLPSEVGVTQPKEKTSNSGFAIQLGSYLSIKEAREKVKIFGRRGFKSEVRVAQVENKTRFRVIIPEFRSRNTAEQFARALKFQKKIESFIVIKDGVKEPVKAPKAEATPASAPVTAPAPATEAH